MALFFVFAAPFVLCVGLLALVSYLRVVRPTPLALGSIFPYVCAVIWDEIHTYFEHIEQAYAARHLQRETRSNQAIVSRRYIDGMSSNTKLFLQVLRFEMKKIDPHKSSLHYEPWETLTLRMVDEASALRWLLVKAQLGLVLRSWVGIRMSRQVMDKILREYKQLEQDFMALIKMASDEVYFNMLVERLGLSNWRLIDGGSPETHAS